MSDALLVALCGLVSAVVSILISRFKDAEIEKVKGELARYQVIFQAQFESERLVYGRIYVMARAFLKAAADEASSGRHSPLPEERKRYRDEASSKARIYADAFMNEAPFLSPSVYEAAQAFFDVVTGVRLKNLSATGPGTLRVVDALTGDDQTFPEVSPQEVAPALDALAVAIRTRLASFGPKEP